MAERLSLEYIKKQIEDKKYVLLEKEYKNSKTKLKIICPEGHRIEMNWNNFNTGHRCYFCSTKKIGDKKRTKIEEIRDFFNKNGYCLLSKKYKGNNSKIWLKCPKKHIVNMRFGDFQQGKRCRFCSGNIKKDITYVEEYLLKNNYKIQQDYYCNNLKKISMICPKGHETDISWANFQRGHRCAKCSHLISSGHQEIFDFLIKSGLNKEDIEFNKKNAIYPLELDIYIPKFKLGIEFDGLYWHSELRRKNKRVHCEKYQKCKENGVNLLSIFEDEWKDINKRKLIEKMILSRMASDCFKKIRASKLKLKKLDKNKDFDAFFDKFHLDGHTQASFAYGLFLDKELISCMSFRRNGRNKILEIARFATNYNYRVYGNASKLISKINEPILTFSNNRLSSGNVYKILGFKEITAKNTQPSYWYTDFKKRVFRTKCKRINDIEILKEYPTERDQVLSGLFSKKYFGHEKPLYRIYDYGHRKWMLDKSREIKNVNR